ncbi:MAG TPA: PAS domain-containing protein, partial [Planctomycetaceae bacterium]|nr:PAS domain-containing protein [Planctomycetaceae bacterium]
MRLLEEVVENVRHGICLFDGDGRIAFCNQRYPEVIGLPSSEVKPGTPIRRLVELASTAGFYPPDLSIDEIETKFWDNLRHDRVSPAQLQRDGRTFVIHPGQTTREGNLVATFEDISAQLAAEAALKQSEKRFSTMLEVMPDCVKIFNERAEITYINPKGLELLQAPDLETLLASGHQSLPSEYILEAIDVHRRVLAGECVVWNYEVIGMKGARRFVEAHAVSINQPDGTRGHMSITRDITGRKMAEDALRHNEERLRLVQEATKLADFENDGGEVSHCSDRFFEQVGLPVGDNTISITTWMDLVHPDDRELLREEMELAIASADTFESEYRIVRPDNGQIRWISCRTRLFRDAEGKLCRTIGAHMDITDRKEHEIALEESEQRMRLVHEATGLAEFWVEKAGFAHVSDALIEQIGLPSGTTNLGFNELLKYVHPEDREILTEYVTSNNRGVNSFNCEFRIIHGRTGEVRWINSRTKSEFDEQGRILRTIGAHLDITDRKRMLEALRESEERFRLAAEGAGIGVWDFDPATQTRDWSARMLEIFGLDGNVERRLEVALDCVHRADRSRFQGMINAVANDEAEKIDDSLRIIRANDNSERWIAINCWKTSRTSS